MVSVSAVDAAADRAVTEQRIVANGNADRTGRRQENRLVPIWDPFEMAERFVDVERVRHWCDVIEQNIEILRAAPFVGDWLEAKLDQQGCQMIELRCAIERLEGEQRTGH